MASSGMAGLRLGEMSPAPEALPVVTPNDRIRADGRPQPGFRDELRRIPSAANAASVVGLYVQTAVLLTAVVVTPGWWRLLVWPVVFVLMGRTHAQFASLMHEAAHRLLFAKKSLNDWVGRWLLGYPAFTSTEAYRRVHMAHHREEFGPDEPDIPLYVNYPVSAASLRRKLVRDATGQTGWKLLKQQLRGLANPNRAARRVQYKIWTVQVVLLALSIVFGVWYLYPVFWLLPYLTVWRVINRLRSIAEHGGMMASKDRRITTHSVRQHRVARFLLVPYNIGWHLAHHVD
ncbi:MAG TPA: fatty acid desaturase, partial [Ilumatobacteraceae bacterium]|nr:fatty acid desaturase [Ilumatobacteraceae bacterium]